MTTDAMFDAFVRHLEASDSGGFLRDDGGTFTVDGDYDLRGAFAAGLAALTPADEAAIRERVEKATEGPWTEGTFREHVPAIAHERNGLLVGHPKGAPICEMIQRPGLPEAEEADCDFIAHARTDVPALLDSNAALRGEVERLRAVLEDIDRRVLARSELYNSDVHMAGNLIDHIRAALRGET